MDKPEIVTALPGTLSVPHAWHLLCPVDTEAFMVPVSQWNRYLERINASSKDTNKFDSLGWGLIGIGVSAVIGAIGFCLTLDFHVNVVNGSGQVTGTNVNMPAYWTTSGFFVVGLAALVGGAACLLFAHLRSKDNTASRSGIFADMTAFAASCKRVPISNDKTA